jgi:hypothetical protein
MARRLLLLLTVVLPLVLLHTEAVKEGLLLEHWLALPLPLAAPLLELVAVLLLLPVAELEAHTVTLRLPVWEADTEGEALPEAQPEALGLPVPLIVADTELMPNMLGVMLRVGVPEVEGHLLELALGELVRVAWLQALPVLLKLMLRLTEGETVALSVALAQPDTERVPVEVRDRVGVLEAVRDTDTEAVEVGQRLEERVPLLQGLAVAERLLVALTL